MSRARREKRAETSKFRGALRAACVRLGLPRNAWKKRFRLAGISPIAFEIAALHLTRAFRRLADGLKNATRILSRFGRIAKARGRGA